MCESWRIHIFPYGILPYLALPLLAAMTDKSCALHSVSPSETECSSSHSSSDSDSDSELIPTIIPSDSDDEPSPKKSKSADTPPTVDSVTHDTVDHHDIEPMDLDALFYDVVPCLSKFRFCSDCSWPFRATFGELHPNVAKLWANYKPSIHVWSITLCRKPASAEHVKRRF
jgi:hypothetical protein